MAATKTPVKAAAKPPTKGPVKAPVKAAAPALTPMQKRLAAMKAAWATKKEESKQMGGGGITVPPDYYITRLTDATLRDGDKGVSGLLQFTIIEGDQTGEVIPFWLNFGDEERMVYAQRDLRRLGVDVDELDITDLEQLMAEFVTAAPVVRIRVVEKDAYLNAHINKVIENYEGAEVAAEETPAEEGIPAEEETPVEEETPAEEEPATEEMDVGSEVTYKVKDEKTKKMVAASGLITKIDGDTFSIKNMNTKKIDKVDKDVAGVELVPAVE